MRYRTTVVRGGTTATGLEVSAEVVDGAKTGVTRRRRVKKAITTLTPTA